MRDITKIHQGKQPVRRHFIREWLEARDMSAMDLLDALNDPERFSDLPVIDKSQVYRWLDGQMPQPRMQARIAGALAIEAADLLHHPNEDWFSRIVRDRPKEEVERVKQMIELAFPPKTGTR